MVKAARGDRGSIGHSSAPPGWGSRTGTGGLPLALLVGVRKQRIWMSSRLVLRFGDWRGERADITQYCQDLGLKQRLQPGQAWMQTVGTTALWRNWQQLGQ